MAISDTGNSKNEFKVKRDIIKENDDSTVIDKEDTKGLGKSQNVMEQDQMLALNKELKNVADTEEDIGGKMDSEEVIPPDKSGLVDILRTFMADSPKPNDDVLKDNMHDEQDPNIDITKQAGVLEPTVDDDQTDSDENSTGYSDLGSSDCPTDPDSDCENESKEDSEPAKNCEH